MCSSLHAVAPELLFTVHRLVGSENVLNGEPRKLFSGLAPAQPSNMASIYFRGVDVISLPLCTFVRLHSRSVNIDNRSGQDLISALWISNTFEYLRTPCLSSTF